MSKKAAEHHRKASEHHTHAARHHAEAAKHHEAGSHEKAAHHAHTARGHVAHARGHAEEAAKAHVEEHVLAGDDSTAHVWKRSRTTGVRHDIAPDLRLDRPVWSDAVVSSPGHTIYGGWGHGSSQAGGCPGVVASEVRQW